MTAGTRADIAEQYSLTGKMPANAEALGADANSTDLDISGRYVKSAKYAASGTPAKGTITVTFNSDSALGDGKTMDISTENPQSGWTCAVGSSNGIEENQLPAGCKD
ncbi:pilin [Halomonas sp. ATCHA]|uniref:Pilin n=1 Tax=Halomonas llamarensis TaxID=2945104 RepID=A0ABT0SMR6_9GAMM|nr:pilin [Halomonas llamarensis]